MLIQEDNYLSHYGILRRSGRYPWGSGDNNPNTRSKKFLDWVADMKREGLSDSDIYKALDMSSTEYRALKSQAKNEKKLLDIATAQGLKDKGMGNTAAARQMGIPESTYRSLIAPGAADKADVVTKTANMLKAEVDDLSFVDVGSGVESYLHVSKERLGVALAVLKEQGYRVHAVNMPQIGTGHETRMKVLVQPGVTQKEAWLNRYNISLPRQISSDGGRTWEKNTHPPIAISPNRVAVRYKEDGGGKSDGMIYVREGVDDVSLGGNRYAQVRVKVGKNHYLKGMAMYKDDLPPGVDLLFNTSKSNTGNKLDAMKDIEKDPDYPFGSVVRQILKDPGTSKERPSSAMNIVGTESKSNQEGSWRSWTDSISSQVLSKQPHTLARQQLDVTYAQRKSEFEEIMALTNPVVKKKLLSDFADSVDSAAVHLKAASLPRQAWHVILPFENMPAGQVYAPNYDNGERVALIRYPHAGTFEIPDLTVNNRYAPAKKALGNSPDAIGINHLVAERLSGADFDGDTVLVIPNNKRRINITPALEGLKDFDPRSTYKLPDDAPWLKSDHKQRLMGSVSNLITDMTIRRAPDDEIVRAVRHSMVVIDAEKHHLNYKLSADKEGIKQLKAKYQGGPVAGASTLISRKKKETKRIPEEKLRRQSQGGPIDPVTGRRVYEPTGKTRVDREGNRVLVTKNYNLLDRAADAHSLSSGSTIETIYADHSNRLKGLANQSRLASSKTPPIKQSQLAKKTYADEVRSLDAKLGIANRNKPLERQAQVVANNQVRAIKQDNPNLEKPTIKKISYQQQEIARNRLGAKRKDSLIQITAKEWDAIQAGAISNTRLTEILDKADMDVLREFATPKSKTLMTPIKARRAAAMLAAGHTRAEVASQLGVSLSTLDRSLSGEGGES